MSGEMSSTYVKIERGENSDEYVPFREDIDTYFVAKLKETSAESFGDPTQIQREQLKVIGKKVSLFYTEFAFMESRATPLTLRELTVLKGVIGNVLQRLDDNNWLSLAISIEEDIEDIEDIKGIKRFDRVRYGA